MKRTILSTTLFFLIIHLLLFTDCKMSEHGGKFESYWRKMHDGTWVGPDFWANRLQDWKIEKGKLVCLARSKRLPMRTVHLTTRRLSSKNSDFRMSVVLGTTESKIDSLNPDAAAGFLIGAGSNLDYRAAALIHHSPGPGAGLFAGIDLRGRLFLKDFQYPDSILAISQQTAHFPSEIQLKIKTIAGDSLTTLVIQAFEHLRREKFAELQIHIPNSRLVGNVALVSHPGSGQNGVGFWFTNWIVKGEKFKINENHLAGPILSTQYTLSKRILTLTAQFMPLGDKEKHISVLMIKNNGKYSPIDTARIDSMSYTATFRCPNWNDRLDIPFRIYYNMQFADGLQKKYVKEGIIRRNPINKDTIKVAAFTGNHNVVRPTKGKWAGIDGGYFPWSWGVWFPHSDLISHVKVHEPDLLFFSGDQVYEGASPTFADFQHAHLDYLYKWYLWCWAFGELTATVPAVIIPDDHDVYHGNIWGAGGKPTPPNLAGAAAQDAGGYKMPPEWVNMVQRTQTSNLPTPYDPKPIEQEISVYYCDLNWGGVSFAIIEDRKFKSAPKPLLPEAKIVNGWAQNPDFDPKTQADVPGAQLLGRRQLEFLSHWAEDWSYGTWMKVVLSQTIFSNVATLPPEAKNGSAVAGAPIPEPGEYIENQKFAADMDSDGWPPSGRNRALRIMRKCFAIHIAGDQHLGSTIQYGIDDWRDASYAICVPSIANFWPRRWFPPYPGKNRLPDAPRYTGDYEDGFGNKMTVFAVSNPQKSGKEPALLHDLAPGYGIVTMIKSSREIIFENWSRWANPQKDTPYFGWPVRCKQFDNYGRKVWGYLPTVSLENVANPVVKVYKNDELIYAIRSPAPQFKPFVFEPGIYRVVISNPDAGISKTLKRLVAKKSG